MALHSGTGKLEVAITGTGFVDEALMKNIGAAQDRSGATNYYSQYRYASLFGHINYGLLERYIVDVTMRRDGSSRFGPRANSLLILALQELHGLFPTRIFLKIIFPSCHLQRSAPAMVPLETTR